MPINEMLTEAYENYTDNAALFAGDKVYSYGDLFGEASRGAAALKYLGFYGNSPVALMGMRGRFTYSGLLSAIMAGGYYVPTNPSYPAARNIKILKNSGAKFAFLDSEYINEYEEVLKNCSGITVITDEKNRSEALAEAYPHHCFAASGDFEPVSPFFHERKPEDFIYLLFTSGSTGEPKGVPITYGNLSAYLKAFLLRHKILPEDRFIQLFDLTFDLSAHQIFLAFTAGACLYVPDGGSLLNPSVFVKKHKITHWASVPTVLSILQKLRVLKGGDFPDMKYAMMCGEALPCDLASLWMKAAPYSLLENLYGPTEATIACLYHKFDPERPEKYSINGLVPIGKAYAGMKTAVADENGKPVKKGSIGELLLAGEQLAPGYLNDPAKTSEKFINIGGEIFYKTGDLVRENEAGLVFIGRADTQIKLRGYRIELSEIENEAAKICGTHMAVALPFPPDAANYTGIALFVQDNGEWEPASASALLAEKLPAYMVPSKIVPLGDFPRNASGKVDRNALKKLI